MNNMVNFVMCNGLSVIYWVGMYTVSKVSDCIGIIRLILESYQNDRQMILFTKSVKETSQRFGCILFLKMKNCLCTLYNMPTFSFQSISISIIEILDDFPDIGTGIISFYF